MKRSMITWLVVGAILLIVIFSAVGSYNGLVSSETAVDNKAAQIDTQLQRREDVIPKLVNTVKGYDGGESGRQRPAGGCAFEIAGYRRELSESQGGRAIYPVDG
jgi:hypothetical protein